MDFYTNVIKFLLTSLILGLLSLSGVFAQETYYYRQVNVVKGNSVIAKGSGGQYISFFNDICYDSNSKGISVHNGTLDRKSKSADYIQYMGLSYWGNVIYQFSGDLSKLSVIKQDGTKYVYQRATPPAGVTTSSLIKSKSSGGGTAVGYTQSNTYYPPTNNGSSNDVSTSSGNSATTTHSSGYHTYESSYVSVDCHLCRGSGKCNTCNGKGWYESPFGTGPIACPNCYGGNQSGKCSKCKGPGKTEKFHTEKVYH